MEDLELGCEELGERERKWRKEHGAGGVAMESLCWDCLRDGPSMLGRGEKQPQEGQWLPSATWKQRMSWRASREVMESGGSLSGGGRKGQVGERKEKGQRIDKSREETTCHG